MSGLERAAGRLERIVDIIGRFGAWCLFALVVVMAGNVLLRYGFSLGSVWAQELEWHLFVPICLLGMSFALLHGDHVRVDIFYAGFPERLKASIDLLCSAIFALIALAVIWLSLRYVGQSLAQDEGSANPGGIPYRYVLKAFIPVGFGVLFLQMTAETLRHLARLRAIATPFRPQPSS